MTGVWLDAAVVVFRLLPCTIGWHRWKPILRNIPFRQEMPQGQICFDGAWFSHVGKQCKRCGKRRPA